MYFVVIAGFMLAAVAYDGWGGTPTSWMPAALGTAAMALVPAAAAGVYAACVAARRRRLRSLPDANSAWGKLLSRHAFAQRALNAVTLGAYAAALYFFGWAGAPGALGVEEWLTASGAMLIAPFVLALFFMWIPLHYADAALRPYGPNLAQRLAFNTRQYILTLLVPLAVVLAILDVVALLPASVTDAVADPWLGGIAGFGVVLIGYTVAPLVMVRLWKTRSMPDGPLRSSLAESCRRAGVRFRDIRIWETPGHHIVNAAVMGVAGFVRYIIVSRTLLEVMPPHEVQAVFAHELAHARRRHMVYYLVFAADFLLLAHLWDAATGTAGPAAPGMTAQYVEMLVMFALYWGLAFGYLSRALERDADLFASDMTGGPAAFAAALAGIARLSGVNPSARSWRHGSIQSRLAFLDAAWQNPAVRARFLRKARFLKAFLVIFAALSAAATVALEYLAR